jgi:biphenyl-2,3-diol 1,2-dioxygenase
VPHALGAGGKEIEPQGWREGVTGPSLWGHKPRLRLQLKMVGELLASKIAA